MTWCFSTWHSPDLKINSQLPLFHKFNVRRLVSEFRKCFYRSTKSLKSRHESLGRTIILYQKSTPCLRMIKAMMQTWWKTSGIPGWKMNGIFLDIADVTSVHMASCSKLWFVPRNTTPVISRIAAQSFATNARILLYICSRGEGSDALDGEEDGVKSRAWRLIVCSRSWQCQVPYFIDGKDRRSI